MELGCGCGLAGFTAARVYAGAAPPVRVVFTDASKHCLSLVRQSAAAMGLAVTDAIAPATGTSGGEKNGCVTQPLLWGAAGARELSAALGGGASLVLGSDLVYYRVDLDELLGCCSSLLGGDDEKDGGRGGGLRFAVLTHFVRVPGGRRLLLRAAQRLSLGAVRVPLASFLPPAVVAERCWQRMEAVLLFRRPCGVAATGEESTALLRARLRAEARGCGERRRAQQLQELAACVQPYTTEGDEDEEEGDALLSINV